MNPGMTPAWPRPALTTLGAGAGTFHRPLALALAALLVTAPLMAQDIDCPPGTRQKAPGVAQCVNTSTPDSNAQQNLVTWFVGIGAAIAILVLVLRRASPGPSTPNPEFVTRPETWPLPPNLNDLFLSADPPPHASPTSREATGGMDTPNNHESDVAVGGAETTIHDSPEARVRP